MKITQSDLHSQSTSLAYSRSYQETQASLNITQAKPAAQNPQASSWVNLSTSSTYIEETYSASAASSQSGVADVKLSLLISLIERLTGKKVTLFDAAQLGNIDSTQSTPASGAQSAPTQTSQASTPEWAFQFSTRSVHEEAESTRYSAAGKVSTADGRTIDFALDMTMQRYERQESSVQLSAGNAVRKQDPLVLNITANQASLQSTRMAFDLNGDGTKENIATLGSGSYFLALDRNGNGSIDNGKELFGPTTNNGFDELAALDDDKNGWIDENDKAWSQLSVWRPGAQQMSLKDAGVGAIALQNRATAYTLKSGNDTLGSVRASGVFLSEDGQAHSIQQLDLTV